MNAPVAPPPADVARENEKLRKIVKVLVDRVERSTNAQGNAFSLFQAAITLENTVRQRTQELHSLNAQLQAARIEAERANLGKTEFLRAASHDLLQPLNVARLIVGALGERDLDDESTQMLAHIARSLEDAEGLLSTLLEMSRIDAGALVPEIADVAIDPLLKRLSDDYALEADERRLRLRVVPCDAVVRTDIRMLERILRNLVSNALRYTDRGGVLVGCRLRGDRIRIEVWDTGIGIPHARLGDVFKEFLRLEGPGVRPAGTGLGLAIVDRLARVLGGRLDVRSREGRGSMFAIDLPLGDATLVLTHRGGRQQRTLQHLFAGKSVLLMESDAAISTALAVQLRGWGLYVLEAQSLAGALAVTNAHGFVPSAIVLGDSTIAGVPGAEVVERLRLRFGEAIPAILLSHDGAGAPGTGVAPCWTLAKPVRVERLRALLSHLLNETRV
jgi:signal transduction histidine kinase